MLSKNPRWAHYVDSTLFDSKHSVECIVDFVGSERVPFGSDTPFDTNDLSHFIPVTISNVEGTVHDEAARAAIFRIHELR